MVLLPIAFVNVLILFGMPLAFCVIYNLSVMPDVLEDQRLFVPNLLLGIGLLGAVLKGFVRPTEDEENPYSQNRRSIIDIVLYLVFIFLLEVFLFLIATKVDGTLPFTTYPLDLPSWAIVFAPIFVGEIMGMIYFAVKGFFEWKLVFKQKDPNGDGWFRGTCFVTMIVFIVLLMVAQVLIIVKMDLEDAFPIPLPLTILPLPIGLLLILAMFIMPFVDVTHRRLKKKMLKAQSKKQQNIPLKQIDEEVKDHEKDAGEEEDDSEVAAKDQDLEDPKVQEEPKPTAAKEILRQKVMMHCFL